MIPLGFGLCARLSLLASTPVISYFQTFLTNQVVIHFDTDANRTYTVQYTDSLTTTDGSPVIWSNLYTTPNIPFPDHYVVVDTRTSPQRFYRLSVTP
jgi:hypothetical protein